MRTSSDGRTIVRSVHNLCYIAAALLLAPLCLVSAACAYRYAPRSWTEEYTGVILATNAAQWSSFAVLVSVAAFAVCVMCIFACKYFVHAQSVWVARGIGVQRATEYAIGGIVCDTLVTQEKLRAVVCNEAFKLCGITSYMAIVERGAGQTGVSSASHSDDGVRVCFEQLQPGTVLLAHAYRRVQSVLRGAPRPCSLTQPEFESRWARNVCPGHAVQGGQVLTQKGREQAVRKMIAAGAGKSAEGQVGGKPCDECSEGAGIAATRKKHQ